MATTTKKRKPTPTELAEARAQEEARAHSRPAVAGSLARVAGHPCNFDETGRCRKCGEMPPGPIRLTRAEVERVLASIPRESALVLRALAGETLILGGLPPFGEHGRERAVIGDLLRSLAQGLA